MNSKQINERLATEIMGWKKEHHFWRNHSVYTVDGEEMFDVENYENEDGLLITNAWNPTECIEHAWMVIVELIREGYQVNITTGLTYDGYPKTVATFERMLACYSGEASTAPLAICLAAINLINRKGRK